MSSEVMLRLPEIDRPLIATSCRLGMTRGSEERLVKDSLYGDCDRYSSIPEKQNMRSSDFVLVVAFLMEYNSNP